MGSNHFTISTICTNVIIFHSEIFCFKSCTYNINHLEIEKDEIFSQRNTHKIQTNTYVTITWQTKKASFKEKFFGEGLGHRL